MTLHRDQTGLKLIPKIYLVEVEFTRKYTCQVSNVCLVHWEHLTNLQTMQMSKLSVSILIVQFLFFRANIKLK